MAKTKSIQPQTLPKSVSKARKSKPKTKEIEPTQEPVTKKVDEGSGSDSEEEDDCDEDDINEAGMKRIIELLGDDGLDRFAQYQLEVLGEQGSEEENDEIESGEGYSDVQDDNESENEAPISPSKEGEATGDDEDEDLDVTQDVLEAEVDIEDLSEVDGDAVLRQQLEYMNTDAMERIRENIKLDPNFSWTETLVVTYPEAIEVDVNDDLKRELAFYKQALHSANEARSLAAKHQFPFTRPADYFAEMVKSDSHMERIRQRLLDETANIKKSEDAKRQREGKKFGKQVQQEKLKERVQNKKEMEERIKGLKRKRKDTLDGVKGVDDEFDIEVEDALQDRPTKRHAGMSKDGKPRSSLSRPKRDAKFGFGGKVGRRAKQNTKDSTDDMFGGGGRGRGKPGSGKVGVLRKFGKPTGGSKRPGRSKRMAQRGR